MQVVIGTKQGVPGTVEPHRELAELMPHPTAADKTEKQKAKETIHEDEFENFMNEIKEMKERRRKEVSLYFCKAFEGPLL